MRWWEEEEGGEKGRMSRIRGPSSLQQSKHIPQYSNRQLPPLSNAVHLRSLQQLSAPRETHRDNIASCHEGAERDVDTREGDVEPSPERQQGRGEEPWRTHRSEIVLLCPLMLVVFSRWKPLNMFALKCCFRAVSYNTELSALAFKWMCKEGYVIHLKDPRECLHKVSQRWFQSFCHFQFPLMTTSDYWLQFASEAHDSGLQPPFIVLQVEIKTLGNRCVEKTQAKNKKTKINMRLFFQESRMF